jgi:hypothetical protein
MAGGSLLALLDDIAGVLDDVAMLAKVAAQKTTGVLGDDLALNAEQVAGVRAERELPVVWAVAKGSFKNKLILVPAALAISALLPWLITPLLMIGGAYLCYEGVEKVAHKLFHSDAEEAAEHAELTKALLDPDLDLVVFEQEKIQGAIRTDFVLSAEIIVISLGTVKDAVFMKQALVVSLIAILMTVGVYGLVALIVKLDDMGLHLIKDVRTSTWSAAKRVLGRGLLAFAPRLMKSLAVIGTVAMFLVGGGILLHGLPFMHDVIHHFTETAEALPVAGGVLAALVPALSAIVSGLVAGALVLAGMSAGSRVVERIKG